MTAETRRAALVRAAAAADDADNWSATLPAVRSLLGHFDPEARPRDRWNMAEGLEIVMGGDSLAFQRQPVARELRTLIRAFREPN